MTCHCRNLLPAPAYRSRSLIIDSEDFTFESFTANDLRLDPGLRWSWSTSSNTNILSWQEIKEGADPSGDGFLKVLVSILHLDTARGFSNSLKRNVHKFLEEAILDTLYLETKNDNKTIEQVELVFEYGSLEGKSSQYPSEVKVQLRAVLEKLIL